MADEGTPLLAGKYADRTALNAANAELQTKGIPAFEGFETLDDKTAEQVYKARQSVLSAGLHKKTADAPASNPLSIAKTPTNNGLSISTSANEDRDISDDLASVGLSEDAIAQEIEQNGSLSNETYALLNQAGYPRKKADRLIEGEIAKRQLVSMTKNQIFGKFGGTEAIKVMFTHFKTSMKPAEIKHYDALLQSNNPTTIETTLADLDRRYRSETGSGGSRPLVTGGTTPTSGRVTKLDDVKAINRRAKTEGAGVYADVAIEDLQALGRKRFDGEQ